MSGFAQGHDGKIMLISRYIICFLLIETFAGVFANPAMSAGRSLPDNSVRSESVARMTEDEKQNWLQRHLHDFATYPHLDRAYRLLNSNRLKEANEEIEKILQVYPKDWQARFLEIIILNHQKKYADVVRHSKLLLEEQQGQFFLYFYMAMAHQQMNQPEEAIWAYEKALQFSDGNKEKESILLALGEIYKKMEDWPKAEEYFLRALESDRNNLYILRTIGQLEYLQKNLDGAIGFMKEVVSRKCNKNDHECLANLLAERGRHQEALAEYQKCLLETKNKSDQARIWARLGYLYQQIKRNHQAVFAFRRAVKNGNESPEIYAALGSALYEQGRWQAAVMEFHRAKYAMKTPIVQLYIGRCYEKLRNPRMAVYHLEEAWARYYLLEKKEKLNLFRELGYLDMENREFRKAMKAWKKYLELEFDPGIALHLAGVYRSLDDFDNARKTLVSVLEFDPGNRAALDELGYYFVERKEYQKAIKAWERAQSIQYDPRIALSIGYCQGLMKKYNAARQSLESIPVENLSSEEQSLLYDRLAAIYAALSRFDDALLAQSKANELDLSPERRYKAGLYYQKLGQFREAVAKFQEAAHADPANILYTKELGYTYIRAGDYLKAAEVLSRVSEVDTDSFYLPKEVGYLYMKSLRNREAEQWFSKAIARLESIQVKSDDEREMISGEVQHIENEIKKLNNRLDVSAYQMYRPDNGTGASASTEAGGGGALKSEGGVEVAYQPPGIGFRDERTFQLVGRTLWSNEEGSIKIDEESLQGGLGFRYKPLKAANLYFGAERLWGIGDGAEDSWLARAIYSLNSSDPEFPRKSNPGRYYLFYIDGAYFFNDQDYGAVFAEWREGVRINLSRDWTFIPHVTISQRWQDPDPDDLTYAEGGGGVILRYGSKGGEGPFDQFDFESLIQYKTGIHNAESGIVLTNILKF
ncbi:MAG: tetratricopeptide repeat protein [Candidatus Omnitrophota bacterium]